MSYVGPPQTFVRWRFRGFRGRDGLHDHHGLHDRGLGHGEGGAVGGPLWGPAVAVAIQKGPYFYLIFNFRYLKIDFEEGLMDSMTSDGLHDRGLGHSEGGAVGGPRVEGHGGSGHPETALLLFNLRYLRIDFEEQLFACLLPMVFTAEKEEKAYRKRKKKQLKQLTFLKTSL